MIQNSYRLGLIVLLLTAIQISNAQENILNEYVNTGLENNLTLKQKYNSYEKSLQALKEARGLFFPDLSFNARYSVAEGGRSIALPIGDLMNPMYSSLNSITSALSTAGLISPANIFPDTSISNQSIDFLRPTEHETKLRLVQPVINSEIMYNYRIKKELTNVQMADVYTYKRQLIADIKSAYFNYLKAIRVVELLNSSYLLVEENLRVNQKLFENDKITFDLVLRAKAELSKLDQQKAEAIKNEKVSGAYFNFLLNRPLHEDIIITDWEEILLSYNDIETATAMAIVNREELKTTTSYGKLADYNVSLNKSNNLPSVAAVVDYGLQGEKYDFSDINNQDYVIASLILKWDLFKGFQNQSKVQQAKIDRQIIDDQYNMLKEQIKLQVISASYDLESSQKMQAAALAEVESLEKAYHMVSKKYALGKANLLELIDAQTSMTNAQQKQIITQYDYLIKMAEFEKITASYQLNK